MSDDKPNTPKREEYWNGRKGHAKPRAPHPRKPKGARGHAGGHGRSKQSFTIDRFEEEKAILLDEKGQQTTIERSKLPVGAKPGDVLDEQHQVDHAATQKLAEETRKAQQDLQQGDTGGAIKIGEEPQAEIPWEAVRPGKQSSAPAFDTLFDAMPGQDPEYRLTHPPSRAFERLESPEEQPPFQQPRIQTSFPDKNPSEAKAPSREETRPGPDLVTWIKTTLENALAQLDARFNELVERNADSQAHVVPQQHTQQEKHEPPQFNEQHDHEIDDRPPAPQAATETSQLENLSARLDELTRAVIKLSAQTKTGQNALQILNDYCAYLNGEVQKLGGTTQYLTASANRRSYQNMGGI